MSGYLFRFQKLMDLKTKEKDEIKTKYAESLQALHAQQQELETLQAMILEWEHKCSNWGGESVPIQQLASISSYIQHLEQLVSRKLKDIDFAEQEANHYHSQLTEKTKECQVWDHWKEKDYQEYKHAAIRMEQKEMDELALQRFIRQGGA
ncbi:flagellar export protein FliJ [Ammoniphilus sp. YIM 78166]|uniref:flagellar export protein FliJ n=1 Tax=Ammoniphilus sp. YIM 78166 TaxID=1644106 RepID=UPI0021034E98|nr:flagellar export protein FliJ [Ammoniphilus sp. YIM 78166]